MVVFFFSSRRRHTRYWRDWSSDVCSSDLERRKFLPKGNTMTRLWNGQKEKWELLKQLSSSILKMFILYVPVLLQEINCKIYFEIRYFVSPISYHRQIFIDRKSVV